MIFFIQHHSTCSHLSVGCNGTIISTENMQKDSRPISNFLYAICRYSNNNILSAKNH